MERDHKAILAALVDNVSVVTRKPGPPPAYVLDLPGAFGTMWPPDARVRELLDAGLIATMREANWYVEYTITEAGRQALAAEPPFDTRDCVHDPDYTAFFLWSDTSPEWEEVAARQGWTERD